MKPASKLLETQILTLSKSSQKVAIWFSKIVGKMFPHKFLPDIICYGD